MVIILLKFTAICLFYIYKIIIYIASHKEFIGNLDGFLQNDFHLKSSFKTKYIFDQSIWECNGHFDHWFSNTKDFFLWHMEFAKGETLSFRFI